MAKRNLTDDLLHGVKAIAAHTGDSERRIRHLIREHDFPAFKVGKLWYARKGAVELYYGGPPTAGGSK